MSGPLLVLGAAGQLGQELMALVARRGERAVGTDVDELDVRDPEALSVAFAAHCPRLVVNCAAYNAVDRAETEVGPAEALNAIAPGTIARVAASRDVPMLHVSTNYVFDGTKATAYVENDCVTPLGVYGRTKAAGEAAVRTAGGRHVVLRTSWLYGRYGTNFLKTMLRLATERPALQVVADQRGCPTATIDLAHAILAVDVTLQKDPKVGGLFHFAGAGATTWHAFAVEVVAAQTITTGRTIPVHAITTGDYPTSARRPPNGELDSSLFIETFGYCAQDWRIRARRVVQDVLDGEDLGHNRIAARCPPRKV